MTGRRPDGRVLDVAIFQRAQAGNVVCGQRPQPVPGQIRPPEVARQDIGPAGVASLEEPHHPAGQIPFVEGVGDQHHVNAGGGRAIFIQDVSTDGQNRNAVGARVDGDGGGRERINVIGGHGRGSCLGRRDGHQPGAGGDIDHTPVLDHLRVVKEVAGQRLAACPGERPEWRVQTGPAGRPLRALPYADRLGGLVQPDLRDQRHRPELGVSQDDLQHGWLGHERDLTGPRYLDPNRATGFSQHTARSHASPRPSRVSPPICRA